MEDIRSVVRLLRDDPGTDPPTPLAGELPELVENFRAGGADIAYSATGCLTEVPAPAALTVYRVVQEGLTNGVRHGTGTIDVTVRIDAADVDVEIVNDRPVRRTATTPGSGLVGMRERVEASGERWRPAVPRAMVSGCSRKDPDVIRVRLVDDQEVVREGLRSLIATDAELTLVGECSDGDEVVEQVERCTPDVVVMDVRMRRVDGATATADLRAADGPPVLVLTTFDDDDTLAAALRAGASGFV